jgi:energy-coupling factor transporter ATP-binding protein EcfA2
LAGKRRPDQLLGRLARNHFLAVTGPSGCGKSSLIKAGMIPALSAGFMVEGGSRWRICELRPGDRPLARLTRALASADILGADRTGLESIAFIEATLRRGPLGLIEIVKGAEALKDANLLVMIDQFEEIFRYRDRIAADEADAFVALLPGRPMLRSMSSSPCARIISATARCSKACPRRSATPNT